MTVAFAVAGWAAAVLLAAWLLVLRARLEAVARADHELRGPVTALALCADALARDPATAAQGRALAGQVARLRAGLADLAAARRRLPWRRGTPRGVPALPLEEAVRAAAGGWAPVAAALGRELSLEWEAGAAAAAIDEGRLAQSLGNLLSNALEHGAGDVGVRAVRAGDRVRVEIRNAGAPSGGRARRDRGRGLAIAARAAAETGGRVIVRRDGEATVTTLELPLAS